MKKEKLKRGECRVCGCTDNNPCYNSDHGNCWWADEEHTICSHCADDDIKKHPGTVHCINTTENITFAPDQDLQEDLW